MNSSLEELIKIKVIFILRLGMGDSRKYPYHTTGGILEFRGRGGVSWTGIPKTWGGNAVWNSKGMGGVSALNSVNFQRKDGESSP